MANHKKNWSEAKKVEVVTTYLALGKAPMVEAVTGVPRQTIRIWKMQQWWKDLEREIRNEEDGELDAKLSRIIDKSLDAVSERLDNGEFILDSRTGQIKRVPVKMRDAQRVSSELLDKRNLIRGKPTSITEKVSVEDVVRKLAEQFAEFVRKPTEKVIEGEIVIDALYEERSSGLCNGEQKVQLQTDNQEKTSSPEQGSSRPGTETRAEYNH